MPTGSVSRLLSIVLIDLVLAGDNALVIAMAVRALPRPQQRIASICGALAAVTLRIALTIVATRLLDVEFLKLAGGALVIWIAVKVLADAHSAPEKVPAHGRLIGAIGLIVFADITMSVDNILAVAGAARGSVSLIAFGLALSIPFVVFGSGLIATLMDRFRVIVYLGVGILGKVGAEMMLTDRYVARTLNPAQTFVWIVEGLIIACILLAGKYFGKRRGKPDAT
jgi:YjbE family integral membrane protein